MDQFVSGLENWMRRHGFSGVDEFVGRSVPSIGTWNELDLGYKVVASIDQQSCIHCGVCYIACEDGAHQAIKLTTLDEDEYLSRRGADTPGLTTSGGVRTFPGGGGGLVHVFEIDETGCVGCNLCSLVCPVRDCITMVERDSGRPRLNFDEYQKKLARGEVEPFRPPEHR